MKYFTGDPIEIMRTVMTEREMSLLTDDDAYGTVAGVPMIEQYINAATGFADSYIISRYPTLNPDTATEVYRAAILVVAKKRLLNRRGYTNEALDQEYADVKSWLRDIKEERTDLFPEVQGSDDPGDIRYGSASPIQTVFGGIFQI